MCFTSHASGKDLISVEARKHFTRVGAAAEVSHLKYANESPIVKSMSNQMYSIGTGPRFVTPKQPTHVAFYTSQDN